MDFFAQSLLLHQSHKGKLAITAKVPLQTQQDLSLAYTPGVAEPCRVIANDHNRSFDLTWRGNTVAIVSDGSAVLGLGNIGPEAAMPVMEGKALLFKQFADIDAVPICLATQDPEEIIETVIRLAPSFGGINLEDIAAPKCFAIETALREKLSIPVFHDDQHGTAIVVLAALWNALKVAEKDLVSSRIVLSGAGAAGIAIAKLLHTAGATDIILCDSKGILSSKRSDMNFAKQELLEWSNPKNINGTLRDALFGSDIFIGVSQKNLLTAEDIATMNKKAIVFAMANPDPEILPNEAKRGGAMIIATGRSDFPNQVNNVLAFPGIFRGILDLRARTISKEMHLAAAKTLAESVQNPSLEKILPSALEKGIAQKVAESVKKCSV